MTEAGLREQNGMIALVRRAMSHIAWIEECRAEKTLKDWVRLHPGAQFQPYGQAMTKARKREVKAWETEVRRVKRENRLAREQERFKNKWEKKWGEKPRVPVKFAKRRQRAYKLLARKARKARMGHPEKVLAANVL